MSLLLTLNIFHSMFAVDIVDIVDIVQVHANWASITNGQKYVKINALNVFKS